MRNFLVTYTNAFGSYVSRFFNTKEEALNYIAAVSNGHTAFEIFDYTKKV